MIDRVLAISLNTFREAVRDRVLHGVLGFAIAVLLFSLALAEVSLNEQERVVADIGLASISLFSVIIAVFLGSSLLYKEIERRTLYVILPKPIARAEFLIGKYLGIVLTALVFVLLQGAVQLYVMAVQRGLAPALAVAFPVILFAGFGAGFRWLRDRTTALLPGSFAVFGLALGIALHARVDLALPIASLSLAMGEVLLLASVAMLFSSFSTPFLTGAFTLGVWLVGRSADTMAATRSRALPDAVKEMLHWLAKILPNFHLFVPGRFVLEASTQNAITYVATTGGYAVLYAAFLLHLSCRLFQRREFP